MRKLPPKPIIAIGLVSLLINTSAVIVYSLTPIYLTSVLGLSALSLGMLEGVVEMLAWSSRIFSGVITDFFRKRKPILMIAYIATAISRPIFAISHSVQLFFSARSIDRVANGLQATARDSLVGDLARVGERGAAYGIRQSLAVTGSFLGGIIALLLLTYSTISYQNIFMIATIPAALGVIILSILVKEPEPKSKHNSFSDIIIPIKKLFKEHKTYWSIILLASIFMLGNYSGFFAILRAKEVSGSDAIAPILMILQNLGGMLAAYPIGYYSDKGNRNVLLGYGFGAAILSNFLFTIANHYSVALAAAMLWGGMMGVTQSLLSAKIADSTSSDLRGSAFGVYFLIMGLMIFISNTIMGWSFDHLGQGKAFFASSFFILIAYIILKLQNHSNNSK